MKIYIYLGIAVIKSLMMQMSKEDFIQSAKDIRKFAETLPAGKERDKLVKVYLWSRRYYLIKNKKGITN